MNTYLKKYRIKVRLRKGSSIRNEPFYDTYIYEALNPNDALDMMRERIWFEYECFNPEVFAVTKL